MGLNQRAVNSCHSHSLGSESLGPARSCHLLQDAWNHLKAVTLELVLTTDTPLGGESSSTHTVMSDDFLTPVDSPPSQEGFSVMALCQDNHVFIIFSRPTAFPAFFFFDLFFGRSETFEIEK
ncbi:hypothetical protein RRG08_001987 [Elysia crispata]|uniref:Uncharacterized protein n=1 Tax=Elysia crispata TaxID=231223 RepID=A0AAE1EDH9_9GAST|nr:hypothetical protein RRG08_001987 [Elysia crispata]